ncbi:MAG: hypothetical protein WCI61_04800 [Chloroflexota bacterium]
MPDTAPPPQPHARDRAAIEAMRDVVRVYVNDSRWWQNASFALPLIVSVISLVVGLVLQRAEGIGFGLFAGVVTLIMIPVVLLTWRSTATSIVLTKTGADALHVGKVLHHVDWRDLQRIERVEYLGNTRYKLVHHDTEFLTVESEIEESADLVDTAFALSGVPRQAEDTPKA